MKQSDRVTAARIDASRSSSSSSTNENDGKVPKQRRSRQKSMQAALCRSVTCVGCGQKPALFSLTAPNYVSWTERYFHVAEAHTFRRFKCPYAPCLQMYTVLMKLNDHIDRSHPGSRRVAEPPSYHDDLVTKVRDYFPVVEAEEEAVPAKPKKKRGSSAAESDSTLPSDDDITILSVCSNRSEARQEIIDSVAGSSNGVNGK